MKFKRNENNMIYLANDHAGFALMEQVKQILVAEGYTFEQVGAITLEPSDSYVTYTRLANKKVVESETNFGIYSCGTGIGTSIAANRDKGIRAALCHSVEFASLARRHNNANVLVLPGRFMDETLAKQIVLTFLTTSFEGGRHQHRVEELAK